jgi:4-hydroxy-tetrahydrodipicolinate synthase
MSKRPFRLDGVTVATVMPFRPDHGIDWDSYLGLLDYCATAKGIAAVFVNGHAGEGAALTPEERVEVIRRTRTAVRPGMPLMAGIIAYSTAEAIQRAAEAKQAGADIAVLFAFPQYGAGGGADPAAGPAYVRALRDAVDIPLSIFQYPLASGAGFTTDVLRSIVRIPGVIAVKEGSGTVAAYEDNLRMMRAEAPHVAMLPSNFDWFLAQCAIGADGILSGLASLCPNELIALWKATEAEDLKSMRRANDALVPIVRSVYGAPPLMDMHTRIKVGLKHLGIIKTALPRPPLGPVGDPVEARVVAAVEAAGLARQAGVRA